MARKKPFRIAAARPMPETGGDDVDTIAPALLPAAGLA